MGLQFTTEIVTILLFFAGREGRIKPAACFSFTGWTKCKAEGRNGGRAKKNK